MCANRGLPTHTWQTPPRVRHPVPSVAAAVPSTFHPSPFILYPFIVTAEWRPKWLRVATMPPFPRLLCPSILYLIDSGGHSRFVLRNLICLSHPQPPSPAARRSPQP